MLCLFTEILCPALCPGKDWRYGIGFELQSFISPASFILSIKGKERPLKNTIFLSDAMNNEWNVYLSEMKTTNRLCCWCGAIFGRTSTDIRRSRPDSSVPFVSYLGIFGECKTLNFIVTSRPAWLAAFNCAAWHFHTKSETLKRYLWNYIETKLF